MIHRFTFKCLILSMFWINAVSAAGITKNSMSPSRTVLILSANPSYPPHSWLENGEIVGASIELAQLIFKAHDIEVEARYFGPWKRVMLNAREGHLDLVATLYRTPERQLYLDYTREPYLQDQNVVWTRKESSLEFNEWEDLIDKKGGAILGDSYGQEFDQYIKDELSIQWANTMLSNFKKLMVGRIDYIPYGLYPGDIAVRQLGYHGEIESLPVPLVSEGLFFAFSKKSEQAKYRLQLEEGIEKLRKDGTVERLVEKYTQRYIDSK